MCPGQRLIAGFYTERLFPPNRLCLSFSLRQLQRPFRSELLGRHIQKSVEGTAPNLSALYTRHQLFREKLRRAVERRGHLLESFCRQFVRALPQQDNQVLLP
jgi:hypothetical protein